MPDSPNPSPDALLAQYRAHGDPDALGELFDVVAPTLYRIALSLLNDVHDADDALQATFLALLQHPERPDEHRPVVPWLVGVLRVEVLRLRRASRRRGVQPASPVDAEASLADDADVTKALEELPEPYRAPSLLRWRYGLTPAEIAHVRDEAPGTTRSLLARALARLRRRLRGRLAGAAPFAGGLSEVRAAVLNAASAARASATPVSIWSTFMTTKQLVLAALAGAAAVGAIAFWFATHPSDAQPTRQSDLEAARTRETSQDPGVPMLHGLPGEAAAVDRAAPIAEAGPVGEGEPEAVESPAWPTPEKLRAILDARVTTEAILGAVEGVNRALTPRVPVRLVTLDSGGISNKARGEVRAESSITLDATTRALSELKASTLGSPKFFAVDPTTAMFEFRVAPPAQANEEPLVHDTWEPGEPGENLATEHFLAVTQELGVRKLGAEDSDSRLKRLGLLRRPCDFKTPSIADAMLLMRKLDEIRGVRVTRVQLKADASTGEVAATFDLTLRLAEPPK